MTEYGLFNDEGLMEGGFISAEKADAAIADRYDEDDGLRVSEVCPDHPEQARDNCDECMAEEEEEE